MEVPRVVISQKNVEMFLWNISTFFCDMKRLLLSTSTFFPRETLGYCWFYDGFGKLVFYLFFHTPYIKLTCLELILYKLVQNSRIFKEIECKPRNNEKSKYCSNGKKHSKKYVISYEFPFIFMEGEILMLFQKHECGCEFFYSFIELLCCTQELTLCERI